MMCYKIKLTTHGGITAAVATDAAGREVACISVAGTGKRAARFAETEVKKMLRHAA